MGSGTVTITKLELYGEGIGTGSGDFVAQGFVVGLSVITNDTDCPGPYLISNLTTTKMTLSSGDEFNYKKPGANRTIYAKFIKIYHYKDGAVAYTEMTPGMFVGTNRFQETNAPCNKLAVFHKLKFILFSTATGTNMRPIVWGYQAFVEREDTE
jgi:hypothetical protein